MIEQLSFVLVLASIYLLFSMGLTLSWGVLNILNLAHGSIFMFGAFTVYLLLRQFTVQVSVLLLALIAAIVGGLLALALQVLVYGPLLAKAADQHSGEMAVLIASIGAGMIPVAIALNLSPAEVVNLPSAAIDTQRFVIGPLRFTDVQLTIVVLAVVLSLGLGLWIAKSQTGRALRTIAVAPGTAELLGVPVARLSNMTMFVSGALAGSAGLLLAVNSNAIEAHMGDSLMLKAFAVVILGGVGSIAGAALGAVLLAVAETAAVLYLSGDARDAVAFAMIIIVLLVRPSGLFGRKAWQRA